MTFAGILCNGNQLNRHTLFVRIGPGLNAAFCTCWDCMMYYFLERNRVFALRLRELPEVRADVMTEVTKRHLKGVLLTRVAAEQAAGAIVDY